MYFSVIFEFALQRPKALISIKSSLSTAVLDHGVIMIKPNYTVLSKGG